MPLVSLSDCIEAKMLLRTIFDSFAPPSGFPCAPRALPLLGHFPLLYDDALTLLRESAEAVGPVFWVSFGLGRWYLFCIGTESIDLMRLPCVGTEGAYDDLDLVAGQSVIRKNDPHHYKMRTVLNPSFSPRGLAQHDVGRIMARVVAERVARWIGVKRIQVLKETLGLTLDNVFHALGIPTQDLPVWHSQYRDFALGLYPIAVMLPGFPRYRAAKARRWLDEQLRVLLAKSRNNSANQGVMSALAMARDENGEPLSEQELIDNLRLLLFAGHETTAGAMAWELISLAQHPEWWTALCSEVRGKSEVRIPESIQEAKEFPCAEAIFREVLRLNPPTWFMFRKTHEPITYRERLIPTGTSIAISLGLLNRDPAVFHQPERFDPSRWLERQVLTSAVAFSPFGIGPHYCLGYNIAWLESVQVLVGLAIAASQAGLAPRLADHALPRQRYFPLGHPSSSTCLVFSGQRQSH